MSSRNQPWFGSESLRKRFIQDIAAAQKATRITAGQAQWLSLLANPAPDQHAVPRVERLLRDDGGPMTAELAGAWLIRDSTGADTHLYLSTVLNGLERFDSHLQLMSAWAARFGGQLADQQVLEFEAVDSEWFEQRMLSIVDQQVQYLRRLAEGLEGLPSLHTALGKTLQQQLDSLLPGTSLNVFEHLALIKALDTASGAGEILASRTLVDAAMATFVNQPLAAGLRQQLLANDGRELTDDQSKLYVKAFGVVKRELAGVYENLLTDYWSEVDDAGASREALACTAYADRYRQQLLDARRTSQLNDDEYAALSALCSPQSVIPELIKVSRLALAENAGAQAAVKLAGFLLLEPTFRPAGDLLLYSARYGFERFTSRTALEEHFATAEGRAQVVEHSSAGNRWRAGQAVNAHLRLDTLDEKPFTSAIRSIIALQKRKLAAALAEAFVSPGHAFVTIDGVLDIQTLFDPRLAPLADRSRWSEALARSERHWFEFSSPTPIARLDALQSPDNQKASILSIKASLEAARSRLDSLSRAQSGIRVCAQTLLNHYFAALLGEPFDQHLLWFREAEGDVVSLSVLLLERITGRREAKPVTQGRVSIDSPGAAYPRTLTWLTPDLLNHVLNAAQKVFVVEYARQIRRAAMGSLRVVESQVIPANAPRAISERLLRLELALNRNGHAVSPAGLSMLRQVLDRPVFSQREVFGLQATEIFIPVVSCGSQLHSIAVTNVLAFQQPLKGHGKPVQWSVYQGLREFESFAEMQLDLLARFTFRESRDRWLSLVADPLREKLRRFLDSGAVPGVSWIRVEGDFIQQLVDAERQRQYGAIESAYKVAVNWQADAVLFENMTTAMVLEDKTSTFVDNLSGEIQLSELLKNLPGWLHNATVADQLKYRDLLVRFRQIYSSRKPVSLLYSLEEYAAHTLRQRLGKDFANEPPDPYEVLVTLTRYTPALGGVGEVPSSVAGATAVVSESLTEYAINRLSNFQDALLSVSSNSETPLPASLDARYITELVRSLDIGTAYEHYLKKRFDETTPGYTELFNQFVIQAPWNLTLFAFTLKLKGLLTETAYEFVENVLSMPDGLARLPVNGRAVLFSEMKLVAAEGFAADVVTGVYLIGPQKQDEGPWILYAVADPDFTFKEYVSQDALLSDLQTCTPLQALVLGRMEPEVQFVYKQGGFMRPRLSWFSGGFPDLSQANPGPARLMIEAEPENFFHCLFFAAYQVLLITSKKSSVTNKQADGAASSFLLELGVGQIMAFLPGRLGGLVGLWQGKELLNASIHAAAHFQLGKASAELATALSILIASREQLLENPIEPGLETGQSEDEEALRWHDPDLQHEPGTSLLAFEVSDISLSELRLDPKLHVYQDGETLRQYAALFGKVYRVKYRPAGWRILGEDQDGPLIKLDNQQRWVLDTDLGVRKRGGALTRLKRPVLTDSMIDDMFIVEARGMAELKRLYPAQAVQLAEAHEKARWYLQNALYNLTVSPGEELDPRAAHIIEDFFGVESVDITAPVASVRQALRDIHDLLVDPAFSPHSSEKYVVGTNKFADDETDAFTFEADPQKRVFLSDRFFFRLPVVRLKTTTQRQGGFNIGTHCRAVVLIHELSHVANHSHDIAYVEARMPFLDMFDDTGGYRTRVKLRYEQAQKNLSHLTPRHRLFQMESADGWHDLKNAESDAKRTVLKIADTLSLESARDKFLNDPKIRINMILSNADSVALLATLLGRERF